METSAQLRRRRAQVKMLTPCAILMEGQFDGYLPALTILKENYRGINSKSLKLDLM